MSTTTDYACEGCDRPLTPIDVAGRHRVCLGCVKARHATAMASGACRCGRRKRPTGPVTVGGYLVNGVRRGGRVLNRCRRCLGNIR